MLARLIMLSLAASLGLAAAGCNSTDGPAADATLIPLPIKNQHYGNDPGLNQASVRLINSTEELKDLGSQDLVDKGIDFKNTSLILVVVGEQPTAGYWAHVKGAQLQGQTIYVQGVVNRPAGDAVTAQVLTYAYAAAEIPKVNGEISSDMQDAVGLNPPKAE